MNVQCPLLQNGKYIPTRFAHKGVKGGENISLPVSWTDVPAGTKSFVLSILERHPIADNWVHWYVVDIPPTAREIAEKSSGVREKMPAGAIELRNTYGDIGYGGPKPPRGSGPHDYIITVYALSVVSLHVGPSTTPEECGRGMKGVVLGSASAVGVFEQ
jgi:Raf kinase inhibitor-like YbhB/YbcL family protein